MKRFMKKCAITALIFLLVGVGMLTAVLILGDREKMAEAVWEATDGKVELRLNSWADFGIHINGNWLGGLSIGDNMFDKDYEVWEGEVKKTQINEGEIEELDIQIGGSSLEIQESADGFYYIEKNDVGKLQAYEENGVLYVKAKQDGWVLGGQKEERVILYVPKNAKLQDINMELGAGEIYISELKGTVVSVNLGAGDMEWDVLEADSLKVELGAGEFSSKNAVVGDLDIDLGAGECEIQGKLQGDVKVDCAAGNVTLKHAGTEDEFDYEIDWAAGSVQVGSEKFSGLASEKEIDNDASKTMEISVAAGSVEVEFE